MFAKFYRRKFLISLVILAGSMFGCKKMIAKFNEQHGKMEKQMLAETCSPPPSMVNSILLEAARRGKTITIKTMLANDANINTRDKNGMTPLMHASYNGYADIVEILLKKGANVNKKNNNGETALMLAKVKQHVKVAALIRQAGAKD